MKPLLPLILVCFLLGSGGAAQEKSPEKWTRLESRNRDVSAAFPPGYLVDTIRDTSGLEAYVYGYKGGVRMEMRAAKRAGAKDQISYMPSIDGLNDSNFATGKLQGRRSWSRDGAETFHETIYLASDSHFYIFTVNAPDPKRPEVERFLYSILVNAKPLYIQKEKKEYPEDFVSLEKIQSSPEVVEAYKRKIQKREIKFDYRPMSAFTAVEKYEDIARPPVVLEMDRIDFKFDFSSNITGENGTRTYHAKLRVNFLANGEISDITAYSDESRGYMIACAESFRKARFIPAWNGDKSIDFVSIEDCTVSTTTVNYTRSADRPVKGKF
jgi:hypothetical protein